MKILEINLKLDQLKKIFEGRFGNILCGNEFSLIKISKNVIDPLEIKESKFLSIDPSKATIEENKKIKEQLLDFSIQANKEIFLMDKSVEKTNSIKKNLPTGDDEELLKFYKDKLSPKFYKALEASLVVRNAYKNKEDFTEMKIDIGKKYPDFGNNLCNLVTRDYFHEHFKELYESMIEDEDFDINDYGRKVEKIVIALPYTVFVTRFKSYEELCGEVSFKLERLKKYGAGTLMLHGLGKENVSNTLMLLEEYKEDQDISVDIKYLNNKKTIITATVSF